MIFVTVGSQKFQFNRLIKAIDELVSKGIIKESVFAQIGYSDYEPKNYKFTRFLNRGEFANAIGKSDIVITHGGTGAIINAIKERKKVIAVSRLSQYGEHVDDHQMQIIKQFDEMNLICACSDCKDIQKALSKIKTLTFNEYHSNTAMIVDSIGRYIEEMQG